MLFFTRPYRIQKFNSSGEFVIEWGQNGSAPGEFTGIAVDKEGYVYVVDKNNDRVQKFDSIGNFILEWDSFNNGQDSFTYPVDITLFDNFVYVVDYDFSGNPTLVHKFTKEGVHISSVEVNWGSFPNGFNILGGIAIDASGKIYIPDFGYARIYVAKFDRLPAEFSYERKDAKTFTRNSSGQITAIAVDELTPVTSVEYSVDNGTNWNSCTATDGTLDEKEEPFGCSYSDLDEGVYDILYRSTDSKTNTNGIDTYGSQQLIVDWTPPVFKEVEEDDDGRLNVYEGKIVDDNPYKLRAYPGDEISGVDYVEFYVDGVLLCTDGEADSEGRYDCDWDTSKYHSDVSVIAYDRAGNSSSLEVDDVVVELAETGESLVKMIFLSVLFVLFAFFVYFKPQLIA